MTSKTATNEPMLIPTATVAPTVTPKPTKEPTKVPDPTAMVQPIATIEPTSTPKPTKAPKPTTIPTPEPTATSKPTATPTPEPTATQKPTATPTPEPTATSKPTKAPESTKIPDPTVTPKPTKTPSKQDPLPTFGPIKEGQGQNLPWDYYTKDNLPEPFTSEEQLSKWLADRSYTLEIAPVAENYGFKIKQDLKVVKVKHTDEWDYYSYEVILQNKSNEIRIVYFTNGAYYTALLDGRDFFIPTIIECRNDGELFYSMDPDLLWPEDGMAYFFKKFKKYL